jgi:hypothetical protein
MAPSSGGADDSDVMASVNDLSSLRKSVGRILILLSDPRLVCHLAAAQRGEYGGIEYGGLLVAVNTVAAKLLLPRSEIHEARSSGRAQGSRAVSIVVDLHDDRAGAGYTPVSLKQGLRQGE